MSNVSHRGAASPSGPGLYPASGINFLQAGDDALERTMLAKAQERVSIRDFAGDGVITNWRSAFVAAHTYLITKGGGTIWFPSSEDRYEVDNTGLTALEIEDSVKLEGEGFRASVLANISTDGTALLNPVGGAFKFGFVVRDIKLESDSTAGHIVDPDTDTGIANAYWQGVYAHCRNPNKSVWHQAITQRGTFFFTFRDCRLEIGTQGDRANVPCIDIDGVDNSFSSVWFENVRFQCNHSKAIFFRATNSAGGNPLKQLVIRDSAVEQCQSGLLQFQGTVATTIDALTFFDTVTPVYGHLLEFQTGTGGLGNEALCVSNYMRTAAVLGAKAGTLLAVSTLTQVAGLATCTTTLAHGYATGDEVEIDAATPSTYEGLKTITVTGANTFTFTISAGADSPATPQTGGIMVRRTQKAVSALSQVAGTATCDTTQDHDLAVGQRVFLSGADQDEYNGMFTVVTVPDSNTFTYAVDAGAVSPATGTIWAGIGSQDILVGPDDVRAVMNNITGVAEDAEVDLNNTSTLFMGRTNSCVVSRIPENTSTVLSTGSGASLDTSVVRTDNFAARTTGGNITATSMIAATLGVEFGGNSEITDMRVASSAIDFGSVAATGGVLESDIALVGVGTTWRAVVQPQSNVADGLILTWRVIADAVRLKLTNCSGAPIDPGSITFLVTAWKQ